MDQGIVAGLARTLDAGGGTAVGSERFVPLARLESGAAIGLDAQGGWVIHRSDLGLAHWAEGDEPRFTEVVEVRRNELEERLAAGAAAAELPAEAVVLAFPAVPLVRALLHKRSAHVCRLALLWLLPSELRELRADIAAVAADTQLPRAVRDLAARLVVPA